MDELNQDYQNKKSALDKDLLDSAERLKNRHRSQTGSKFDESIDELDNHYNKKLDELSKRRRSKQQDLKSEYDKRSKDLKRSYDEDIGQAERQLGKDMPPKMQQDLQQQYQDKKKKLDEDFSKDAQKIEQDYKKGTENLEEDRYNAEQMVSQQYNNDLEKLADEYDNFGKRIQKATEKQLKAQDLSQFDMPKKPLDTAKSIDYTNTMTPDNIMEKKDKKLTRKEAETLLESYGRETTNPLFKRKKTISRNETYKDW
jgi:hypothetical protein